MLRNVPGYAKLRRAAVFLFMDSTGYMIRTMDGPTTPNKLNNQVRDQLVGWYKTQIKDNPELLDKVTPKCGFVRSVCPKQNQADFVSLAQTPPDATGCFPPIFTSR
jgi:hypothetical protein